MEGMIETSLAPGEEVVRRYPCTTVDRVGLFAGTVIPLPGSVESEGMMVLTNKRLIFDFKAREGMMHQESRISDVSSISSMMSKFGRDLRVPTLFIIVGFILMFAPYVYYAESGEFDLDGEYQNGYNDGIEFGYFDAYLKAIQSGQVADTIPEGYYFYPEEWPTTPQYRDGYSKGSDLGRLTAEADASAGREFSVPTELKTHYDPGTTVLAIAIPGCIVFILGSVIYLISNTTKDWVNIRFGSGSTGVCVRSFAGGWNETGYRAITAEDRYWDMTRELGAAILDLKHRTENRLRVVEDDDVVIESDEDVAEPVEEPGETRILERVPDFDYNENELIIDDDGDEVRIIGPWREG